MAASSHKKNMAMAAAVFSPVAQKFGANAPLGNTTSFAANRNSTSAKALPQGESVSQKPLVGSQKSFSQLRRERKKFSEKKNNFCDSTPERKKKYARLRGCGTLPAVRRGADGKLHDAEIQLVMSKTHGHASFAGVGVCGNVWGCPVCAAKIKARRGAEVSQAFDWWLSGTGSKNHHVAMLTLTHPHQRQDKLNDNIERHNAAVRMMTAHRTWKELGFEFRITGSEVTWGASNGWHWHQHVLLFYSGKPEELAANRDTIAELWIAYCKKAGFSIDEKAEKDMMEHSVDLMVNCHASDYLTKCGLGSWGADREVGGNSGKRAQGGRFTPFGLLMAGRYDLFEEYLDAVKGKRQLVWSRGFKKLVGIGEKSDAQLAEEAQDDGEVVAIVPKATWAKIVERKLECILLEVCESLGSEALFLYAESEGLRLCRPSPPV